MFPSIRDTLEQTRTIERVVVFAIFGSFEKIIPLRKTDQVYLNRRILSIYVDDVIMASKTISVTDEVYNLLLSIKLPNESFGDAIKRLCLEKSAKSLRDWIDTQKLWEDMSSEEKDHWDRITERKGGSFTINEVNLE